MQYTTLGKTGLKVSVAGLGCGGNSRIGLGTGLSEAQSIALVREALDLGVNFLDTANAYETEGIVGKAIKGRPRDSVVISTKSHATSAAAVLANLDNSLRQLDTDYVDIFHLHGLGPAAYDGAMSEIVPALLREKAKGKLRHLAVSETGPRDPEHKMLARAVEEDAWEVFMLGFSMMHQNAAASTCCRERARRGSARSACSRCAISSRRPKCCARPSPSWQAKAKCRRSWPLRRTRSASWCTRAALRASSTPLTALRVTSQASTSCFLAQAMSRTCGPTLHPSCARRYLPPTLRRYASCSEVLSALAWIFRIASRRRREGSPSNSLCCIELSDYLAAQPPDRISRAPAQEYLRDPDGQGTLAPPVASTRLTAKSARPNAFAGRRRPRR